MDLQLLLDIKAIRNKNNKTPNKMYTDNDDHRDKMGLRENSTKIKYSRHDCRCEFHHAFRVHFHPSQ